MQQQHCAKGLDISLLQHPNGIFLVCFFSGCLQCLQQVLAVHDASSVEKLFCTKVTIGCAISEEKYNTNIAARIFINTNLHKNLQFIDRLYKNQVRAHRIFVV
jgi:hypothetical protein